jgi:hypothetical protein
VLGRFGYLRRPSRVRHAAGKKHASVNSKIRWMVTKFWPDVFWPRQPPLPERDIGFQRTESDVYLFGWSFLPVPIYVSLQSPGPILNGMYDCDWQMCLSKHGINHRISRGLRLLHSGWQDWSGKAHSTTPWPRKKPLPHCVVWQAQLCERKRIVSVARW